MATSNQTSNLIFLYNELQSPNRQRDLRIPLEFICFGIAEGRMYSHFRNQSTFVVPNNALRAWGNTVVYGGLFLCKDFFFYQRLLDAYHVCSLSTMMRNHEQDIHHRIITTITSIHFASLSDLASLKYREGQRVEAHMYIGNLNHPKIKQRLTQNASYRIISGIDKEHFTQLFGEVTD